MLALRMFMTCLFLLLMAGTVLKFADGIPYWLERTLAIVVVCSATGIIIAGFVAIWTVG